MMTWYRVQSADRDVTELLDPDYQVSRAWHDERNVQDGVSVMDDLDRLYTYLGTVGVGVLSGSDDYVVVELEAGDVLGLGQDEGEWLVRPSRIISVRPMDDADYEAIGAAYDAWMAA